MSKSYSSDGARRPWRSGFSLAAMSKEFLSTAIEVLSSDHLNSTAALTSPIIAGLVSCTSVSTYMRMSSGNVSAKIRIVPRTMPPASSVIASVDLVMHGLPTLCSLEVINQIVLRVASLVNHLDDGDGHLVARVPSFNTVFPNLCVYKSGDQPDYNHCSRLSLPSHTVDEWMATNWLLTSDPGLHLHFTLRRSDSHLGTILVRWSARRFKPAKAGRRYSLGPIHTSAVSRSSMSDYRAARLGLKKLLEAIHDVQRSCLKSLKRAQLAYENERGIHLYALRDQIADVHAWLHRRGVNLSQLNEELPHNRK